MIKRNKTYQLNHKNQMNHSSDGEWKATNCLNCDLYDYSDYTDFNFLIIKII